jgi:predicted dehydrogenase
MKRVRVGMIGAGFAARLHTEAWQRVYGIDAEIVAVASAHGEPTAAAVISNPHVDLVDVCVPNHLHAPLALDALAAGKHVIVEKPLTGCFVARAELDARAMLDEAVSRADAIVQAADDAGRVCGYAENWVYAPPVAKAVSLLSAAGGAILRIQGEESHSGTHSEPNKHWVTAGGGSLIGKGCHPLGAALYLKRLEGAAPVSVTAETHSLTKSSAFTAHTTVLRSGYEDVEDFGLLVCTFDDGTVAEIVGADVTLGGVRNLLHVYATNAVIEANLNPNSAVRAYAPDADVFADAYLSEKLETHGGWSQPSPDEDWMQGYPQEIQDFAEAIAHDRQPASDARLGRDVLVVIYGAYLAADEGRRIDLSPWFADRRGATA